MIKQLGKSKFSIGLFVAIFNTLKGYKKDPYKSGKLILLPYITLSISKTSYKYYPGGATYTGDLHKREYGIHFNFGFLMYDGYTAFYLIKNDPLERK